MTSGNSRRQKGSLAYVTHQAQIQIQIVQIQNIHRISPDHHVRVGLAIIEIVFSTQKGQ